MAPELLGEILELLLLTAVEKDWKLSAIPAGRVVNPGEAPAPVPSQPSVIPE